MEIHAIIVVLNILDEAMRAAYDAGADRVVDRLAELEAPFAELLEQWNDVQNDESLLF